MAHYQYFGWQDKPAEVAKITQALPCQDIKEVVKSENLMARTAGSDPVLPYLITRKIIGGDVACGPQKIGDCVSWGWGGANNYVAILQIAAELNKMQLLDLRTNNGGWVHDAQDHENYLAGQALIEEYQETCTEWIYGSSRVEIGGQKGDTEDGSVGAWAMKAVTTMGTLSRKKLGPYDPNRAKEWGRDGVPDNLEPEALKHLFKSAAPVLSYNELLPLLRAYRLVPVCSNQGFTETRDSKGRCRASGTWNHCMLFCGVDGEGWPLCAQSWGPDQPGGSRYLDQPSNTFFVDPQTADRMLRQQDSFSPTGFLGYEVEDFIDWHH